ncbi:MAG: chromosomal replication initiator DnaA [Rhizobiales bacterium]|nr:chromosomal replication initiator DnaA [Hyphomicrobiales bacterium]
MPDLPAARQLALALAHNESFALEDFLPGPPNAAAFALVTRWPDWPSPVVALAGQEAAGKSHLAAIWAEQAGARFLSSRALRGADLPAALATGALVVEDIAPDALDETALFHLLNLVREESASLLLTARTAPAGWRLATADLASRLRAMPVATLGAPDDATLRAVFVKLFADRQLTVDAPLLDYLLSRSERSFTAARTTVERLDGEALRLKRPVTRALAAELFRTEPP